MDIKQNEHKLELLKRIGEKELLGLFDEDVEDDPPYKKLSPGEVDYTRKKLSNKIKAFIADHYSFKYFNGLIRKGVIVIDGYEGIENLTSLKSGAVITSNHFNPFDSIPIHKVCKKYQRKRRLYKIIKEGNFSYPGLFGFFMKNCYTLPLSENRHVMKECLTAVDEILQKGDFILVYAEQSLWWNYRKPKPLKNGAFNFAVKNNVPVLPMFITMRDTDNYDADGFKIQAYTLHILKPIYKDPSLTNAQNIKMMKEENEKALKELYEKVYGIPLTYTTKK